MTQHDARAEPSKKYVVMQDKGTCRYFNMFQRRALLYVWDNPGWITYRVHLYEVHREGPRENSNMILTIKESGFHVARPRSNTATRIREVI